MDDEKLTGKVVVLTGASSGFGKGSALKFAEQGAHLVLAARRDELLEDLAEQCQTRGSAYGVRAFVAPTDVSDPEEVKELCDAALKEFGSFDVWVNNAGAGAIGEFTDVPLDAHLQVIKTDLIGTLAGSYYAFQHFKERGKGTLINIASVVGVVPNPGYSSYAAAKHGVVGLSAVLRQEAKSKYPDIHVCTVLPTSTDTPFFQHSANYSGKQVTPKPPVYDAQDVVDVIVELATSPQDHVAVGAAAKAAVAAHHIAPDLTESMMTSSSKKQEKKKPPAPESEGSLYQPKEVPAGGEVSGGWRKK